MSGSNPDDPQDSIAASYSQASSPEPSPDSIVPNSASHTEPPLMTIPPHVMAELLKTAQNSNKDIVSRAPTLSDLATQGNQHKHQISAQHNKQDKHQHTHPTSAPTTTSAGQLSFQGHFTKTGNIKQTSDSDPPLPITSDPTLPITVFRPIAPKNKIDSGTLNKAAKPPDRIYKPASIIKSQTQPIILSHQHHHLPLHLLQSVPQRHSDQTQSQDTTTAPQN